MYTVENSKFNRESEMDTILHQRASSYCMPSEGGRQTLCTDEAERRQRFPNETRDLTLNVEYQSCAPQHAPVVQRIEQRGQESKTNAPVHTACLPEEEGRRFAQTKRSVVNGFRMKPAT